MWRWITWWGRDPRRSHWHSARVAPPPFKLVQTMSTRCLDVLIHRDLADKLELWVEVHVVHFGLKRYSWEEDFLKWGFIGSEHKECWKHSSQSKITGTIQVSLSTNSSHQLFDWKRFLVVKLSWILHSSFPMPPPVTGRPLKTVKITSLQLMLNTCEHLAEKFTESFPRFHNTGKVVQCENCDWSLHPKPSVLNPEKDYRCHMWLKFSWLGHEGEVSPCWGLFRIWCFFFTLAFIILHSCYNWIKHFRRKKTRFDVLHFAACSLPSEVILKLCRQVSKLFEDLTCCMFCIVETVPESPRRKIWATDNFHIVDSIGENKIKERQQPGCFSI